MTIEKEEGFVTIINPESMDIVLRSLPFNKKTNMVRIDTSYFPEDVKMVYLFIDKKNLVTYCCDVDSKQNTECTDWKKFVIPEKNLKSFFTYYQLRFHPFTQTIKL